MRVVSVALTAILGLLLFPSAGRSQGISATDDLVHQHSSAEWANIAQHLPDPSTSDAQILERAADTLRARRYPSDAVRYYAAAIERGGDQVSLLKKMGISCLEMQQVGMAHTYFKQAVRLNKNDAGAWNNLGASEFILRNIGTSIRNYQKAVKLDSQTPAYHANLALAYFEARRSKAARVELAKGLALDPDLLHKSSRSGYTAQILASERYSEICFEMARIYSAQNDVNAAVEWLTKASDRGYDVRSAIEHDSVLRPLLGDARVQVLLKNRDSLEARAKTPKGIPSLGTADR